MEALMERMRYWIQAVAASLISGLWTGAALAQQQKQYPNDQGTSAAAGTETWYSHPWVWILGAALFVIVIVALTNRGGRTKV
jgi:hypothetical protein